MDPTLALIQDGQQLAMRSLIGFTPGSRVLERPGLLATIVPALPWRSLPNGVVYADPAVLEDSLDELQAVYEDEGITAWMVWVPEADEAVARMLAARGHVLDAEPRAMIADLDALVAPAGPEPGWDGTWDMAGISLVQDRAYGDPDGSFAQGFGDVPPTGRMYTVRHDGEAVSFVWVNDNGEDCVFMFAATRPEAQGRGYVGALLHRALTDARERGCRTSTTWAATKAGRPLYERIGYRTHSMLQMWERRTPS